MCHIGEWEASAILWRSSRELWKHKVEVTVNNVVNLDVTGNVFIRYWWMQNSYKKFLCTVEVQIRTEDLEDYVPDRSKYCANGRALVSTLLRYSLLEELWTKGDTEERIEVNFYPSFSRNGFSRDPMLSEFHL